MPKTLLLLPDGGFRTQENLCLQDPKKNIGLLNFVAREGQGKHWETNTLTEEHFAEPACMRKPPRVLPLQGSLLESQFIPLSLTGSNTLGAFGVGRCVNILPKYTCLQCKQAWQFRLIPAFPLSCKAEGHFGSSGKIPATATHFKASHIHQI